ncbi:MAG TPA: glycosyltransferase WbuB, partial [Thermotoga sp.]|nr:glycosyltransferase WbuB [Thermotoga sp.]
SQADYLVSVKETAKDLQNVFFFDPVPKRCVPYLLQKADVLLFTLSQTVMDHPAVSSYKVVDYMASGKPVLCVDIENLPFKKTKGAVFFREGNLEEALRKILDENPSEFGKRNREYVERERDWDRLYEKLRSFVLS